MSLLPTVALNYAYCLLREGRWMEGWKAFEQRPVEAGAFPNLPRWTGKESLAGKRLLIVPEGGYGDAIYFARWLPWIWSLLPASITMLIWDDIVSLLEYLTGAQPNFILESEGVNLLQVGKPGIGAETITLAYDYFVPLMSLAACLGIQRIAPFKNPYLSVEPWKPPEGYLRVGVCLTAEENRTQRPHRSVPQNQWTTLLRLNDKIRWYCLDKIDYSVYERDLFPQRFFDDGVGSKGDWLQTAKLIAGLDLVISVDTAVYHLAGALGKKTWLLLPKRRDWKHGTRQKPFHPYPNLRYFQQDELVSWKPTLRKVRKALEEL